MPNEKEKEEDQITISIPSEFHTALIMAALKYKTSISGAIKIILSNAEAAEEFRSEFLPKAIEYNKEEMELTAASPLFLKHARRKEEPEKKKI